MSTSAPTPLFEPQPVCRPAPGRARLALMGVLCGSLWLGGCALVSGGRQPAVAEGAPPSADGMAEGGAGAEPGQMGAAGRSAAPAEGDIATRHALFKVSAFDSLPGWQQDNLGEAWAAFKESCKALERKPGWKALCTQVKTIKDPKAGRALLEREFTLLTVQNTDRSREGEITGYYEPLLAGQAQRGGAYVVPVYGVPHDLYVLDWKALPAAQRKGVATVRVNGRLLVPARPGEPGAISVDLRRFTLDTLDRRLRVRLQGNEGVPYYNRADINRQASLNAPVLAWVDDPIALYAMQVQGAGRIRLPDGRILRLQYADQNGHPFKPMQLAAQGNERVQTRGRTGADEAAVDDIEHFELALPDAGADAVPTSDEPLTRGGRKQALGSGAGSEVDAAVASLTPPAGSQPSAGGKAKPAPGTAPTQPRAGAAKPGSQQLVDDLLGQAQTAQAAPKNQKASPGAQGKGKGAAVATPTTAAAPAGHTVAGVSAGLLSQRNRALDSDPSYVFFRIAPDQSSQGGPVGALGVPLTAGRSLAVDPRVMPLGYPVFLDAAGGDKRQPQMQRLMFAQDTGGAIRGAVRADYFWGFGADAGKQARRTKHRGRMWVMVPHAEVQALLSSKLVTRGRGASLLDQRDCLIDDEAFCDTAADSETDLIAPQASPAP